MTTYIALLRAVNVGGTGKLPMADLRAMCTKAGFAAARTYVASGNVLFRSEAAAAKVKAVLEASLAAYAGKPVGVVVRTAAELAAILKANPFPRAAPNRTVAIFLDARRRPMRWLGRSAGTRRRWGSGTARFSSITARGWEPPSSESRRRKAARRET